MPTRPQGDVGRHDDVELAAAPVQQVQGGGQHAQRHLGRRVDEQALQQRLLVGGATRRRQHGAPLQLVQGLQAQKVRGLSWQKQGQSQVGLGEGGIALVDGGAGRKSCGGGNEGKINRVVLHWGDCCTSQPLLSL